MNSRPWPPEPTKLVGFLEKIVFVAGLLVLLWLGSCTTASGDQVMQSWVGDTSAHLIQSWGPADEQSTDGQGGTVFVYYRNDSCIDVNFKCTLRKSFYAHENGEIYFWRVDKVELSQVHR